VIENSIIQLQTVRKSFGDLNTGVVALDNVSVAFSQGSFTAVMGPSGSGKSTLLNCAAGLDAPTSGTVTLDGQQLTGMSEVQLTKLRRSRIGFIFQSFNLLPALTVLENITLPLQLAGKKADKQLVDDVISRVGLTERRHHRPNQLSGGQQQRVAIARALVMQPAVIFGDEPTGALDTQSAKEVLNLLRDAVATAGQTVVMVTHDPIAASHADRVLFLADGKIVKELEKPSAAVIAETMTQLGALSQKAKANHTTEAL
jgi:putative ABC transport system ATP-binding protein